MRYLTNFDMQYNIIFKEFYIDMNKDESGVKDILLTDKANIFKLDKARNALSLEYSRLHAILLNIDPDAQILKKVIGLPEPKLYLIDSLIGTYKTGSSITIYTPVVYMRMINFSLSIVPDTSDVDELSQRISQLIDMIEEIDLVLVNLAIRGEVIADVSNKIKEMNRLN